MHPWPVPGTSIGSLRISFGDLESPGKPTLFQSIPFLAGAFLVVAGTQAQFLRVHDQEVRVKETYLFSHSLSALAFDSSTTFYGVSGSRILRANLLDPFLRTEQPLLGDLEFPFSIHQVALHKQTVILASQLCVSTFQVGATHTSEWVCLAQDSYEIRQIALVSSQILVVLYQYRDFHQSPSHEYTSCSKVTRFSQAPQSCTHLLSGILTWDVETQRVSRKVEFFPFFLWNLRFTTDGSQCFGFSRNKKHAEETILLSLTLGDEGTALQKISKFMRHPPCELDFGFDFLAGQQGFPVCLVAALQDKILAFERMPLTFFLSHRGYHEMGKSVAAVHFVSDTQLLLIFADLTTQVFPLSLPEFPLILEKPKAASREDPLPCVPEVPQKVDVGVATLSADFGQPPSREPPVPELVEVPWRLPVPIVEPNPPPFIRGLDHVRPIQLVPHPLDLSRESTPKAWPPPPPRHLRSPRKSGSPAILQANPPSNSELVKKGLERRDKKAWVI